MNPDVSGLMYLHLFGRSHLQHSGQEVHLSPYQMALLALVAGSEPQELSRRQIIDLLWDDSDEPALRHRLSQLIYALDSKLQESPIKVAGETITISTKDLRCDVDEFHRYLRVAELSMAWDLWSAGFLTDLRRYPTARFEQWTDARRASFRTHLQNSALELSNRSRENADWHLAASTAQVLLDLNPENEEHLRTFMLASAANGNPHRAEATYKTFARRVGATRLGDPTERLLERIQTSRTSFKSIASISPPPNDRANEVPPLCGREEVLASLSRQLSFHHPCRVATEQTFVTTVICGEGGIGKSRIAEEALRIAELSGVLVLGSNSTELGKDLPLAALIEALATQPVGTVLHNQLDDPWRSVVLSVIPEFTGARETPVELPYVQPRSVQRRLFEALRRLLEAIVESVPLILFLDDFQWADDTTAAALDYVRRRWTGGHVRLVISVRPEEVTPGSKVDRFIERARREAAHVIELGELTANAAQELAKSVSGDAPPKQDMRWLTSLAGGNPFFLIELTAQYVSGELKRPHFPNEALILPVSVRQLLRDRIRLLPSGPKRVLEALAVWGSAASPGDLSSVTQMATGDVIESLDTLQRVRIITWRGREILIRHELIRQAVYRSISNTKRAWLHNRVGHRLHTSISPCPIDKLAIHYDLAGNRGQATRYSWEAARHAEAVGAFSEAIRFLNLVRRNTKDPDQATRTLSRLAELHYLQLNYQEATPLLERVAERHESYGYTEDATIARIRLIDIHAKNNHLPESEVVELLDELIDRALASGHSLALARAFDVRIHLLDRAGHIPSLRTQLDRLKEMSFSTPLAECVRCRLGGFNQYYGDPTYARRTTRTAVLIAHKHNLKQELLRALTSYIAILMFHGRLNSPQGIRAREEAFELAQRSGDLFFRFSTLINIAVWYMDIGDLDTAVPFFTQAHTLRQDSDSSTRESTLYTNFGEFELARGRPTVARTHFRQVLALSPTSSHWYTRYVAHAGLGLCDLADGQKAKAREHEHYLDSVIDDNRLWLNDPSLLVIFYARILVNRGRMTDAMDFLENAASHIENRFILSWIRVRLEQARLALSQNVALAADIAAKARDTAIGLGLETRARQLSRIVSATKWN